MAPQLAVEVHGNGDPVLLVHGLGGTSNVFGPQVGVLSRFFQCIRPDLPGSGRSPADGQLSIAGLAEAIEGVMDERGLDRVHLVGHSLGTIVCQHVAVRCPNRVRSLALIGPLHAPPDAARPVIRDRATKARAEGMVGIADAIVQAGTSADTKANRPEVAALVREILMRQDPEGYARTCEALAAAEPADVSRIACPTLLVTGDEDGTAPPTAVRALHRKIAGSSLRLLDRCGHWTTFERPAEVNEALMNFLFSVD
ncbi:alpha/beta fold hydrolase [Azospirillum sp. BE72]|uniref:alpha/beta fold hydrolase n=1 Tax=Azospirillum sp. BE72 TaxID=2817776 RepID=UPI00285FE597|nr:alpha/beta fold hydrolase [Azospirillum sp. BE72]MDR6775670.1 pimeloyl-ACP methyl ester carboxylesterase [Azospirillum sp. BE72]